MWHHIRLGAGVQTTDSRFAIAVRDSDAVLFDLDGVVTDSATLHIAAWKELFDGYLKARATRERATFRPFDTEADYRQYVDGKPRYGGVKSFLESHGKGRTWLRQLPATDSFPSGSERPSR